MRALSVVTGRHQGRRPIKYVRQSGGSTREHIVLSAEQAMSIIENLQEPVRTMALLDACTGLRASELTALRWEDVDFQAGVLHVRRGIVYAVVGDVKSSASRSNLPLAPYAKPIDWIFANPRTRGKKPYRGQLSRPRQLKLAKEKAGVEGPVGWHTFRRSISTWLIENDENVKVIQELMRHRHVGTTLDLYAKAVSSRF